MGEQVGGSWLREGQILKAVPARQRGSQGRSSNVMRPLGLPLILTKPEHRQSIGRQCKWSGLEHSLGGKSSENGGRWDVGSMED